MYIAIHRQPSKRRGGAPLYPAPSPRPFLIYGTGIRSGLNSFACTANPVLIYGNHASGRHAPPKIISQTSLTPRPRIPILALHMRSQAAAFSCPPPFFGFRTGERQNGFSPAAARNLSPNRDIEIHGRNAS